MIDSNKILIQEDDGTEVEMEILFTFESDEGVSYVLFTDPKIEEGEVYACRYDEDGNLIPVEDEDEWAMVEEVFNTFIEDEDFINEEEKN